MRDLRRAWGIRIGLPATEWMLAIGAFAMQTETELILKSRRVVPRRLLGIWIHVRFPNVGPKRRPIFAGGARAAADKRDTPATLPSVRIAESVPI